MTIDQAIDEFILACQADGLRPATVRWYRSLLQKLAEYCHVRSLTSIRTSDMRQYIVSVREKKQYSADTIHALVRVTHRFWKWCAAEYQIPNPMGNIRYPKQPKPQHPKAVDLRDVERLLSSCGNSRIGIRNKAIIAFLLDTGCRAAGLTGLKMRDLDVLRGRAIVVEKGEKRRIVFFGETTRQYLLDWIKVHDNVEPVFYDLRNHAPLTPSGLFQLLKRIAKRAKIRGRVNPHSFRHAFAREYLKAGGDVDSLARLMGHSDFGVTMEFYGVFTEGELKTKHDQFSPIQKIKVSRF